MSEATNFLENELIDHIFRGRSYSAPTTLEVGLFTAVTDGETGSVTEVSGGSYARAALNPSASNWEGTGGETTAADSSGTGGQTKNKVQIDFPTPTANWGTVTHFGIYDGSGNLLLYSPLDENKAINSGDPVFFPVDSLTVTFS